MAELKSILLAEDNACDAELILEALAEFKFANRIDVVRDGVEALEYLRRQGKYSQRAFGEPAVVILDIKMPRLDGIDVLRAIRADPALKLLPVVMLTSSQEDQDVILSYELGANAYVVKPVSFSEFSAAVKQIGMFWAVLNELPPRCDPCLQNLAYGSEITL
ncbi:MAG: response regulator [bacterium]